MNQLLQWIDPPPRDARWERKIAMACEWLAIRDAEVERLKAEKQDLWLRCELLNAKCFELESKLAPPILVKGESSDE
jgi:hypothetical protein